MKNMTKHIVKLLVVCGILYALVAWVVCLINASVSSIYDMEEKYIITEELYSVKSGDTLWTIAKKVSLGNIDKNVIDVRIIIDHIREVNRLGTYIYIGDTIAIPVFLEKEVYYNRPALAVPETKKEIM